MKQGSYKTKTTYKSMNTRALLEEGEENDDVRMMPLSKDIDREITSLEESEGTKEQLRRIARVKNKEILREIVGEYERRGNFVRIYPAPGAEIYEKYF